MIEIRPIRSEADYTQAIEWLEQLWGSPSGTQEGDQLDVLATLIDAYESEHYPIDEPRPEAMEIFESDERDVLKNSLVGQPAFQLFSDGEHGFVFRLVAGTGEVVLNSPPFKTKSDAIEAIRRLQESVSLSRIIDEAA
jgi:uncharacterized protein YegP (UPF0339 family)